MIFRALGAALTLCAFFWHAAAFAEVCKASDDSATGLLHEGSELLPQRCDEPGKCRIFDLSGRQIGAVGDFQLSGASGEGVVAVEIRETGLKGYMDAQGNWAIPPRFKRANRFCEGLAAVQMQNGQWAYVDHHGHQIGRWEGAESLTEGRGLVTVSGPVAYERGEIWLHGYVDTSGRLLIPARFLAGRLFSGGRAAVRIDGEKWGYIDREGKVTIEPQFAEAGLFHEGRAVVRTEQQWAKNSGLIDESGAFLIPPDHEQIARLGEADLWSASNTDPGYRGDDEPPMLSRLFDRDGRSVSKEIFDGFGAVSEGLIVACRNGKCGYLELQGKPAIPLRFENAEGFEEGLAAVSPKDGKYGFIDRQGKFAIEARYGSLGPNKENFAIGPFSGGLAAAGCRGRWGYIDPAGAWVVPPLYRFAEPFANGFAEVTIRTGKGHIRRDGSAIDFSPNETDSVRLEKQPCGAPLANASAR